MRNKYIPSSLLFGLIGALCIVLSCQLVSATPDNNLKNNNKKEKNIIGLLLPHSGLGDQSFNDMTHQGLLNVQSEYSIDIIIETVVGVTNTSRNNAIEKLLAKEATIIVLNGFEFENTVKKYALLYPERYFIINDVRVDKLPNVYSSIFRNQEPSFLAGVLAARMTKTKKIGFIGGKNVPEINSYLIGFKNGIHHVDKSISVEETYLSEQNDFFSGFDNPALGFTKANNIYDQGIDIIFGAAGRSGKGIIRSAMDNQKFMIGVDADQDHLAKGIILTSVMKRIDIVTRQAVIEAIEGNFRSGVHSFGLKEAGMSLSPMKYTAHLIPSQVKKELETTSTEIIKEKLEVMSAEH